MRFRVVAAVGVFGWLALIGGAVHATAPAGTAVVTEPVVTDSSDADQIESVLAELMNRERAAEGLGPLEFIPGLNPVSDAWVRHMSDSATLAHNPTLLDDVEALKGLGPWVEVGENVGYGRTAADLHRAFMSSDSHQANVLHRGFTHFTVAATHDGDRWWVCVLFLTIPG